MNLLDSWFNVVAVIRVQCRKKKNERKYCLINDVFTVDSDC